MHLSISRSQVPLGTFEVTFGVLLRYIPGTLWVLYRYFVGTLQVLCRYFSSPVTTPVRSPPSPPGWRYFPNFLCRNSIAERETFSHLCLFFTWREASPLYWGGVRAAAEEPPHRGQGGTRGQCQNQVCKHFQSIILGPI